MKTYLTKTWGAPPLPSTADLTPADVMHGLQRATLTLRRFAVKHFVLNRGLRTLPFVPGEMASQRPAGDARGGGARQTLTALVDRHLILRESDGSLSVHPAVRISFANWRPLPSRDSGPFDPRALPEPGAAPGIALPSEKASLDLVEEAVFHAIQAGESGTASRSTTRFSAAIGTSPGSWGKWLAGCGSFADSIPAQTDGRSAGIVPRSGNLTSRTKRTICRFRADLRLLQGRLVEVEREGDLRVRRSLVS